MVDEARLVRLLQRVTDERAYLGERAVEDREALRGDLERLSGLKYRFVTVIEGMVNVAHHLCASEGWGPPGDNADALRELGRHGVVRAELAVRLAGAVGFRNVLVHRYTEVDDDKVVDHLDELGDMDAFVTAVSDWLAGQREAGG